MYTAFGFAHATAYHALHKAHRRLSAEDGQGTVEYIGLILLLAGVMVAVVGSKDVGAMGESIVQKLKTTITNVGKA